MLNSSENTFTETLRTMFDQIPDTVARPRHCGPAKFTDEINHHSSQPLCLRMDFFQNSADALTSAVGVPKQRTSQAHLDFWLENKS